jgi:hypothetical protein
MDEQQQKRALSIIAYTQCALDQGAEHFDCNGKRLKSVSAIIEAWAHGGLIIKEPEHRSVVAKWMEAKKESAS